MHSGKRCNDFLIPTTSLGFHVLQNCWHYDSKRGSTASRVSVQPAPQAAAVVAAWVMRTVLDHAQPQRR